jgi:hypothetical protein
VISLAGPVTIVAVEDRKTVNDWLAVPYAVFAGDPAWVAPLLFMERRRISPKHAPFFTFGEAKLFLAYRGARPVGRISAQINRRHIERYRDNCGHFGFFDCEDDQAAAQALIDAAADWLHNRGMSRMVGPQNFSLNEECGCLVSGFDTPPAILMTHARRWFGPLLEAAGLEKEMDVYAYRLERGKALKDISQLAELARQTAGVSTRQFDMKRYVDEVRTVVDIFNDAWSENWGFVPFSAAEIDSLLAEMRPLFRGHYGRFVLVNGEPVGMIVGLPNINQAIAPFRGRLLPFNWLKLWWLLHREAIPTARAPLMGIRKAYQATPLGGLLLTLLMDEFHAQMKHHNLDWAEFSWVLESNKRVTAMAERVFGPPVKTYRLYGKSL